MVAEPTQATETTTPAPAPAPETSPTPASEATPADQSAPESTAQEAPEATGPDPRTVWTGLSPKQRADLLKETDWDEVVRDSDWLQGKIGKAKQQEAARQRAEREQIASEVRQQLEQEAEETRLRAAIAADDPFQTHELVKRQYASKAEQESTQRAQAQLDARIGGHAQTVLGTAALAAVQDLPETVRAKILYAEDGRTARRYAPEGTVAEGLSAFIAEVAGAKAELLTQERLHAERPKLRKEIEAAVKKELNGEAIGDEPVPDTGSGSNAPNRGPMTQDEWNGIRANPDLRRDPANLTRFQAGKQAGLITY